MRLNKIYLKVYVEVMDALRFEEYSNKNTNELAKEIQDKTNERLIKIRKQ